MKKYLLGLEVVAITLLVISFFLYNTEFCSIVTPNIITLVSILLFLIVYIAKIVMNKTLIHRLYFLSLIIIFINQLLSRAGLNEILYIKDASKLAIILLLVLVLIQSLQKLKSNFSSNGIILKINSLFLVFLFSSLIVLIISSCLIELSEYKIGLILFTGAIILGCVTILFYTYHRFIKKDKIQISDFIISFDITKLTSVLILFFVLFYYSMYTVDENRLNTIFRGVEINRIDKNVLMEKGDKLLVSTPIYTSNIVRQIDSLYNLEIHLFECFKGDLFKSSNESDFKVIKKNNLIRDIEINTLKDPYQMDKVNFIFKERTHYFEKEVLQINQKIEVLVKEYLVSKKIDLNGAKTKAIFSIIKEDISFMDFPKNTHKNAFPGSYKKWNAFYFKKTCLITSLFQLELMEKEIAESRFALINLFILVNQN
jgi:hypothetical protein